MSCKNCKECKDLNIYKEDINWKDITEGGMIPYAGNADSYETGSWRSMVPVWHEDKCKHCMMCFYVCPDSSILVNQEGKMTGIDFDHCKGCGVCVKTCKFGAFDFVEEEK